MRMECVLARNGRLRVHLGDEQSERAEMGLQILEQLIPLCSTCVANILTVHYHGHLFTRSDESASHA